MFVVGPRSDERATSRSSARRSDQTARPITRWTGILLLPLGHLFGFRSPDGLVAPTPSSRNEDGPDDAEHRHRGGWCSFPRLGGGADVQGQVPQIAGLYEVLAAIQPSPVVELNRDPRPHAGREHGGQTAPILRKAGFTRTRARSRRRWRRSTRTMNCPSTDAGSRPQAARPSEPPGASAEPRGQRARMKAKLR